MKRWVRLTLCLLILATSLPWSSARAAPDPDTIKGIIVTKLKSYSQSLDNRYQGEYGLLYNMYYLSMYSRWTELIYKADSLNFSSAEKNIYRDDLLANYKKFNETFAEQTDQATEDITSVNDDQKGTSADTAMYLPAQLSSGKGDAGFKTAVKTNVSSVMPDYLESVLKQIQTQYGAAGADTELVISDNKEYLRYIYRTLQVLSQEQTEMQSLLGLTSLSPDTDPTVVLTVSLRATQILQNSKYAELLLKGKSLSEEEAVQIGSVDYPDTGTYVEKLAYVSKATSPPQGEATAASEWSPITGYSGENNSYRLRDVYMAMIASSSIYEPFVSHTGDKDYLDTLAYLTSSNDNDAAKVKQLYNEVVNFRKPLYFAEDTGFWNFLTNSDSDVDTTNDSATVKYAGSGERVTLQKFIERIDSEQITGLVTMTGEFRQSGDDTNAWSFNQPSNANWQQTASNTATEEATAKPEDAEENTEPTDPEPAATEPTTEPETPAQVTPTTTNPNDTSGLVTMATEKTNTVHWTSTLFQSGYADFYPITGLALMKNLITEVQPQIAAIKNKESRSLFINAFGDIVTDDNLVIIPAASNPMLYDSNVGYNPYSVAFMNGYPSVFTVADKMKMGNPTDKGKYLFMTDDDKEFKKQLLIPIAGDNSLSITHAKIPIGISNKFVDVGQGSTSMLRKTSVGIPGWLDSQLAKVNINPGDMRIVESDSGLVKGVPVFPYSSQVDKDKAIRNLIAYNMYWSYRSDSTGTVTTNFNGRLREDWIFKNILTEALQGSIYASAYDKNMIQSYADENKGGLEAFYAKAASLINMEVDRLGNIDGVMGVKNRYQDPLLGKFLMWIEEYFPYIMATLFLIYCMKFMRQRASLWYSVAMLALTALSIFSFIKIVPVFLPSAYNMVVNNVGRDMSYQIMAIKAEKYSETYANGAEIDDDGKLTINTTSLNLYHLTDEDMETTANKYKLNIIDMRAGKPMVVDPRSGLYLQGDTLRVNVDTLLATNPITGSYGEGNESGQYQYTADKMYSSAIDYYTPYYSIVDGFVGNINKLLQVYQIPKHSTKYQTGLEKDSFSVYSYINSAPFLTPNDLGQEYQDVTAADVVKLKSVYDNPADMLSLTTLLTSPTPEVKQTLWYQTMQVNGFTMDTPEGKKKIYNLVNDVNMLTRDFIIDLNPQVGMISDENLMKLISLYATTIFSQKVGTWGNEVYPMGINYQDYTLRDVMLAAVTDDYSKFVAQNLDLGNYIVSVTDPVTMFVFIIDLLMIFLISLTLSYTIPFTYLSLGLLVYVKYAMNKSVSTVFMGFVKVALILFGSLTMLVVSLSMANKFSTYAYIYLGLVLYSFLLYVVLVTLYSVITNYTELGNTALSENRIFGKIGDALSKIPGVDKLNNAMSKIPGLDKLSTKTIEQTGGDTNNPYTDLDGAEYSLSSNYQQSASQHVLSRRSRQTADYDPTNNERRSSRGARVVYMDEARKEATPKARRGRRSQEVEQSDDQYKL